MSGFVLSEHKFKLDNAKFMGERGFFDRVKAKRQVLGPVFKSQADITNAMAAASGLIHHEYIPALGRAVTAQDLLDSTSGILELCRQRFDEPVVVLVGGYLEGVIEYCRDNVTGFENVHGDWQNRARPVESALRPGTF